MDGTSNIPAFLVQVFKTSYLKKLVSIKSLVQGDKPACKVCKINIEISLIRLHVAKHILCQKVSADVCGFCGTNCNSSLALRLSSGSKAKGVKTRLFGHMV